MKQVLNLSNKWFPLRSNLHWSFGWLRTRLYMHLELRSRLKNMSYIGINSQRERRVRIAPEWKAKDNRALCIYIRYGTILTLWLKASREMPIYVRHRYDTIRCASQRWLTVHRTVQYGTVTVPYVIRSYACTILKYKAIRGHNFWQNEKEEGRERNTKL